MTRSILKPTTRQMYGSEPSADLRWSSWWRRMLRSSSRGVSGLGYGRPRRGPRPAAGHSAPCAVPPRVPAFTERLRIATFVFNNALPPPAVLAHDLATLDVLS